MPELRIQNATRTTPLSVRVRTLETTNTEFIPKVKAELHQKMLKLFNEQLPGGSQSGTGSIPGVSFAYGRGYESDTITFGKLPGPREEVGSVTAKAPTKPFRDSTSCRMSVASPLVGYATQIKLESDGYINQTDPIDIYATTPSETLVFKPQPVGFFDLLKQAQEYHNDFYVDQDYANLRDGGTVPFWTEKEAYERFNGVLPFNAFRWRNRVYKPLADRSSLQKQRWVPYENYGPISDLVKPANAKNYKVITDPEVEIIEGPDPPPEYTGDKRHYTKSLLFNGLITKTVRFTWNLEDAEREPTFHDLIMDTVGFPQDPDLGDIRAWPDFGMYVHTIYNQPGFPETRNYRNVLLAQGMSPDVLPDTLEEYIYNMFGRGDGGGHTTRSFMVPGYEPYRLAAIIQWHHITTELENPEMPIYLGERPGLPELSIPPITAVDVMDRLFMKKADDSGPDVWLYGQPGKAWTFFKSANQAAINTATYNTKKKLEVTTHTDVTWQQMAYDVLLRDLGVKDTFQYIDYTGSTHRRDVMEDMELMVTPDPTKALGYSTDYIFGEQQFSIWGGLSTRQPSQLSNPNWQLHTLLDSPITVNYVGSMYTSARDIGKILGFVVSGCDQNGNTIVGQARVAHWLTTMYQSNSFGELHQIPRTMFNMSRVGDTRILTSENLITRTYEDPMMYEQQVQGGFKLAWYIDLDTLSFVAKVQNIITNQDYQDGKGDNKQSKLTETLIEEIPKLMTYKHSTLDLDTNVLYTVKDQIQKLTELRTELAAEIGEEITNLDDRVSADISTLQGLVTTLDDRVSADISTLDDRVSADISTLKTEVTNLTGWNSADISTLQGLVAALTERVTELEA